MRASRDRRRRVAIEHAARPPRAPRGTAIVALLGDRLVQARVCHAAGPSAAIAYCATREELLRLVEDRPRDLVITELWDAAGRPVAPAIRYLRAGFPTLPVVAYCVLSSRSSPQVLAMARAGAAWLVFEGFDDIGRVLGRALAEIDAHLVDSMLERELGRERSACIRAALAHCLEHPCDAPTVSRLATCLGMTRRTLLNHTVRESLPAPGVLIGWCRLLLAARMLEDPARSVEQAALALGFPTGTALRNMLRRYTGLRPREVREGGGLTCMLRRFKDALSEHRARRACPSDGCSGAFLSAGVEELPS